MVQWSAIKFWRDQWRWLPVTKKDLTGRTVVVVGANVGLGFEAARHFASMNPGKLILACRSQSKGDAAKKDIESTTGCKTIEVRLLDLADFSSVKNFADTFEKSGERLDLLLANAAIATGTYEETKDGWETTIQVNHLSTVLLTLLLIPALSKSPHADPFPRIVVVSSDTHIWIPKLQEADNKSEKILQKLSSKEYCTTVPGVMRRRYPVSKLMNVFFTRALGSRLPPDSLLTIDAVNPGLCYSSLARNVTGWLAFSIGLRRLILARSTEVGSRTLIHAALGGSKEEVKGRYLSNCMVEEESDYVLSKEGGEVEERIWNETIDILKRVDSRVGDVVGKYLTRP